MKFNSILSFSFIFLFNCLGYSPSSSDYWENLVGINQAMHKKFFGTNINAIVMGSLSPKDEDQLFPIDENKLYISIEAKRSGNSWIVKKTRSTNPKAEFTNKTTYTKIQSGKDELYEVYRKQYTKIGDSRPSIAFSSISQMIIKDPSSTETQKHLCRAFHCNQTNNQNGKTLEYSFGKNTQATYPAFYEKFSNRFKKLRFNCVAIPDGKRAAAIRVENVSQKLLIHLPGSNDSSSIWEYPKRIDFYLDFSLDSYGLNFKVNKLHYILKYNKSGTTATPIETLEGRFAGTPKSNIEGRFFYVIPQGFVNFFIPEDIETYLTRGLELVTVGSDEKKGNRFFMKFVGKDKNSFFEWRSHSEIYRNKFSLFGDKKPDQEEGKGNARVFFNDFWLAISRDLAQQVK